MATWNSDGSAADIQTLHDGASNGDTITVPAGSFSWGFESLDLDKGITLQGAGVGVSNVTLPSHPSVTLTKNASAIMRIRDFTFISAAGSGLPHPIVINGAWPGDQPIVIQDCDLELTTTYLFDVFVAGGVIFSGINLTTAVLETGLLTVKDTTHTASWTTADSMGDNDTDGTKNIYIEDSTFYGGGLCDADDNCRIVVRHCTFAESSGFNSHGLDTSAHGLRHFEIYDNEFTFPDKTCEEGNDSLSNISWYIWIRGGTGVVYNNVFENLYSACWGDKREILLSIRGAEDARPQGSCGSVSYPVPRQLGQSHNGTSYFTDPIWFWNNTVTGTPTYLEVQSEWQWGNPCSFDWNDFFEWGRDAENTSLSLPVTLDAAGGVVSGLGGTAKPDYTAYTYPHPLVSGDTATTSLHGANVLLAVRL